MMRRGDHLVRIFSFATLRPLRVVLCSMLGWGGTFSPHRRAPARPSPTCRLHVSPGPGRRSRPLPYGVKFDDVTMACSHWPSPKSCTQFSENKRLRNGQCNPDCCPRCLFIIWLKWLYPHPSSPLMTTQMRSSGAQQPPSSTAHDKLGASFAPRIVTRLVFTD
ncbi:hypothetical protein B0I37DRAFT_70526 [Chaetomium sp. MPI-CAGE-AT-0009]|nr:hypothetical protein B0I37DRAFT_70526 [Chaetomium sp. MPI-CAGE-AT-0009]